MKHHELDVPTSVGNPRLDKFVASSLPELSRARVKALIEEHLVQLNGVPSKPSALVRAGDAIRVTIPDIQPTSHDPEAIPLDVLFEDESIIVLNKAPGLVVHPGAGNQSHTMVNALLHHATD